MNKLLKREKWDNKRKQKKNDENEREYGKKLKKHLEIEFEQKKNHQIYWDDVAMFCYPDEYKLGIYPISKKDIVEIDNLQELAALDTNYKKYLEEC